jgi:release factor glutamine methyltransferase
VTQQAAPSVVTVLEEATRRLTEAGVPEPRRDAAALLAIVLGTDRGGVAARKFDPIPSEAASRYAALIAQRARRAPMQHIEGRSEFRGLTFDVGPAVLIPRPETEDLVEVVLEADLRDSARIADLGTGSGCIAIALSVARAAWRVVAVDASPDALSIARANAKALDVSDRIDFVRSDFGAPDPAWRGTFDAVVSNPPYIAEAEWRGLAPEVRDHEPKLALVPGPDGNEAYAAIAPAAFDMLRPGGLLALELGYTSEAAVRGIVSGAGFSDIAVRPDMQGIPRVLTANRRA